MEFSIMNEDSQIKIYYIVAHQYQDAVNVIHLTDGVSNINLTFGLQTAKLLL